MVKKIKTLAIVVFTQNSQISLHDFVIPENFETISPTIHFVT